MIHGLLAHVKYFLNECAYGSGVSQEALALRRRMSDTKLVMSSTESSTSVNECVSEV